MQYVVVNKYHNGYVISDVFSAVFDVVLGTAFYIGEQCLEPAALPVFTRAIEKEGEARAWRYASTIFNLQFFILLITIAMLCLFPSQIISVLTEWNPPAVKIETSDGKTVEGRLVAIDEDGAYHVQAEGKDVRVLANEVQNAAKLPTAKDLRDKAQRREMAQDMMPWIAAGLLGMSLASLTYVLLNGYKEFFFAAFGDAMLKLAILVGAVVGAVASKIDWHYIAIGAVAGGTLKLVTHVAALGFRRVRNYRLVIDFKDPYVREFFWLVLPLLAGILLSRFRDSIIFKAQSAQATLPTYFNLGKKLTDGIGFVIPYTLSIAMLPYFCDISERDDRKQLGEVLTRIVRMIVWFFVPLSIILAAAALPTTMALYEGEKFGAKEAGYVSLVLRFFCLQLPFLAVEMMVMQAFFSSRRTIAPTITGFVFSTLAGIVPFVLLKMGYISTTLEILVAIALSLVAARVLKSVVLIALLKQTVPVLPLGETISFALRIGIAGAVTAAATWSISRVSVSFAQRFLHNPRVSNVFAVAAVGVVGAAIYLALSFILGMDEPRQCWQWTREKLKRRKAAGGPKAA